MANTKHASKDIVYTYLKPVNRKFLLAQAKKNNMKISGMLDTILDNLRTTQTIQKRTQ